MVSFRPVTAVMGPLPNGRTLWLINGGDPNHLLIRMILQVGFSMGFFRILLDSTGVPRCAGWDDCRFTYMNGLNV